MTTKERPEKPLGIKAYGSIPHFPGSRLGPGDHHCHDGQARICTEKTRDKHDIIIVQEKVDGSCCSVARINGEVVALGRAGYRASSSPFEQHRLFHDWVAQNETRFRAVLQEGERLVGEWLAQAHGTRYELPHEPFVVFDRMVGTQRITVGELSSSVANGDFITPYTVHVGGSLPLEEALQRVEPSHHGALDAVEGVVYRVERRGEVDFLAKYVRPDKVDGCYLPELTNAEPVWNWRPEVGT